MDNFKRGGRSNFKGGFRGGDRGDRGDRDSRGPVTMHSAICSTCGKTCEVPFRPTGEKPVYCRDCFAGRAAMGGERSDRKDFRKENRDFASKNFASPTNGSNDEVKKQLETVNTKLERLIDIMQKLSQTLAPVKVVKEIPKVESKETLGEMVKGASEKKTPGKIEAKMAVKKTSKKK